MIVVAKTSAAPIATMPEVLPFATKRPLVFGVAPPLVTVKAVRFPLASTVALEEAVCNVCDPPPVTICEDVRFPAPTTVTVPVPPNVPEEIHAPSPRQKCELSALVPLFRFVTGKLPVT